MEAYLLAIIISACCGAEQEHIPLALFSSVDDCIQTANKVSEADIMKDEHDMWCIPVRTDQGAIKQAGE